MMETWKATSLPNPLIPLLCIYVVLFHYRSQFQQPKFALCDEFWLPIFPLGEVHTLFL